MALRSHRLGFRHRYRRSQKQVEGLGLQAEEQAERLFFKRISHLAEVRRFMIGWLLVPILLGGVVIAQTYALGPYYTKSVFASGGTYTEGVLGSFTNANPLYATSSVDSTVARLVFGSLFQYDTQNRLVGQLASAWSVDDRGTQYVVTLKPHLKWQDGQPLTAADIVYTYQTIQNPDAKSPLFSSWKGIKIEQKDDKTVVFTLPNALTAFPSSLTNGVVPKHLLEKIPVSQLRSARFNTVQPVGAGPFSWSTIEVHGNTPETREEQVALLPNDRYVGGRPKLDRFIVRSFHDQKAMVKSFQKQEISAMSGLESLQKSLETSSSVRDLNMPITGETAVFFKTTNGVLQDIKVRQALIKAVNLGSLLGGIGYPVIPARGPLLSSHVGYDPKLTEFSYNLAEANALLEAAGWIKGQDGIRHKDNKALSFTLHAQVSDSADYLTQKLQSAWRSVGVDAKVTIDQPNDLQVVVNGHSYDALLYSIATGTDPDVFAYWHSSQADIKSGERLNFSEYKSAPTDKSLEAGRNRSDPAIRAVKYRPFLEAWRADAPALTLYQPRFLFVTVRQLHGPTDHPINIPTDRFADIEKWTIREEKVAK